MIRLRAALLLALAVPLTLGGCGYSTGFVLPEGRATVGVEFFGNQSKMRDLEAELHGYLTDAVTRMVHAELVAASEADYVIRGEVLGFNRRRGIRSPDNVLLETGVRVSVEAQLWERGEPGRTGARGKPRLVREHRYATETGFRLEEPLGEQEARDRVLRNLADEVVIDLFGFLATREAP